MLPPDYNPQPELKLLHLICLGSAERSGARQSVESKAKSTSKTSDRACP